MSHYSNYQASQYHKLFNKYASHESGMLSLPDLYYLMMQFGMEIPIVHLKTLLYIYDSRSRNGLLDFDDFLLFLGDYDACRLEEKERIEKAFSHFQRKTLTHGMTRNDLRYILQLGENALPLDQIQEALQDYLGDSRPEATVKGASEFYTKNYGTGLAWCDHQSHTNAKDSIVRDIVIRSLSTNNLNHFARTKLRRGHKIEYFTLDPFVTVECAGITQETTILVGETHPSWTQELTLQVKFPATTDFFELQRWIEGQRVTFHLYDYIVSGVGRHTEWIATGHLPLATALASSGSPITAEILLKSPTILPPGVTIKLEVSLVVNTDRLTPYFELPEEIWVSKYHPKMRQDLQFGLRPTDDAERFRETSVLSGNFSHVFWEYYNEFYQQIKMKFRRRYFQLVGLNEYNQFWCLACFVRPLYATSSMNSPEVIAKNVARIGTHQLIPSTTYHPHTAQVGSPALVLFRKYGSPLEHAILLCDLFLGLGMNAYVCIGTSQSERTAFVVTFDTLPHHLSISSNSPAVAMQHVDQVPTIDSSLVHILPSAHTSENAALSSIGNRNAGGPPVLRRVSSIIISPPASDDESDDDAYDEAIAFVKQNLYRKIDTNSVNLKVGQDVFSLIENLSKKKYTGKKKTKAVADSNHAHTSSTAHKKQTTLKPQTATAIKAVTSEGKERMLQVLRSKVPHGSSYSNGSGNKILRASALQFDESKFVPLPSPTRKLTIWDPTTGRSYNNASHPELPFPHVGCIFNNRNVWINVQKYDHVSRVNWEIDKTSDWLPFLDEDIKEACGPIQCWYSEPTQLSEIVQEDPDATLYLVKDLAQSLQSYRRNNLDIPESPFFAPICKILQDATKQCESELQQQQDEHHNYKSNTPSQNNNRSGNHNHANQKLIAKVESEILAVLPNHHSWHGKPYHFYHSNVDEIMQQISWTGILDCTVPHVFYGIGAQVFDYPWGLTSVWVYIGYCIDLFYDE